MKRTIEIDHDGIDGKDYYETNSVSKGKSSYSCEECGKSIPTGTPSDVHKFYPEFQGYRTHPSCSAKWLKSIGADRSTSDKIEIAEKATTKDQKEIEKELLEIAESYIFNFHEAKVSGVETKLDDFEDEVINNIYSGGFDPFKTSLTTDLKNTILFEVYNGKIDYEIC